MTSSKGSFYVKAAALSLGIVLSFQVLNASVRIGFDAQPIKCIPEYSTYLVNLWSKKVKRDRIYVFRAQGLAPYFKDGAGLIKYARGVPGDELDITKEGVFINGDKVVDGLPLLERLDLQAEAVVRSEVIPEGHYLFLGTSPESYDGRYWGYVKKSQIKGRGHPLY